VGKEVLKRGIPHDTACDELVQLIKDHGRWVEPPAEEEEGAEGNKQLVGAV
jgi:(E)-4-hydroxy-3-methylbut-2-enyl-diphosphate synthase